MNAPDNTDRAWPWVRFFLETYLVRHRGVSRNTLLSYRTAFRLFRRFLEAHHGRVRSRELKLDELQPALVLEYLAWLQSKEGGSAGISTRNVRMAALRSFFRCLELYSPAPDRVRWERFRHLPQKRAPRPVTHHLDLSEVDAVFAQIDLSRREGLRDVALLAMLYNTGARASEAAGVRLADLSLDSPPTVRLRCKGKHERRCPLWPSTAAILRRYWDACRGSDRPDRCLFLNQRGQPLTRHGIARRVARYITLAAQNLPSLRSKRLSVHSFRHTTAVHLLESGADMHVIKTWLGHRSTRSTDHYLDLNLQAQRELLARFSPPPLLDRLMGPGEADPDDWLNQL